MQITNMNGMSKISADISKLILSLDPLGDPMYILLRLDSQLVISGQYDLLKEMWENMYPIGKSHANHFHNPVSNDHQYNGFEYNVQHLPGWHYSLALSIYYSRKNQMSEECENAFFRAIEKWPFVLYSIAAHADVDKTTGWKKILSCKYICESRPEKNSILEHISDIYGIVSSELWKRDELGSLLERIAMKFIKSMESKEDEIQRNLIRTCKETYTNLSIPGKSHLEKYMNAQSEDFYTEFIRFPPDVHPIDAQFMDPALLARDAAMYFRFPNIFGGGRDRRNREREIARQIEEAFDDAGIDIDEFDININTLVQEIVRLQQQGIMNVDLLQIARQLGMNVPNFQGGGGGLGGHRYALPNQRRLDPTLPLLQLLWMSLLPWFYV